MKHKRNLRLVDIFEKSLMLILCLLFIRRLRPSFDMNVYSMLLLLSECMVLFFILTRRPTEEITTSIRDWFVAFSGSLFPLLAGPGGKELNPVIGGVLLLTGLIIHVGSQASLFRSVGIVPANRGVTTKGLYAFVRHPMYAGYLITHIGYLIAAPSGRNLTVYLCCWCFQLMRIFSEERLLLRSPEYRAYHSRVRYRLVPFLF